MNLSHILHRFACLLPPARPTRPVRRQLARELAADPGPWRDLWRQDRSDAVSTVAQVGHALERLAAGLHPRRGDEGLLARYLSPEEFRLLLEACPRLAAAPPAPPARLDAAPPPAPRTVPDEWDEGGAP